MISLGNVVQSYRTPSKHHPVARLGGKAAAQYKGPLAGDELFHRLLLQIVNIQLVAAL